MAQEYFKGSDNDYAVYVMKVLILDMNGFRFTHPKTLKQAALRCVQYLERYNLYNDPFWDLTQVATTFFPAGIIYKGKGSYKKNFKLVLDLLKKDLFPKPDLSTDNRIFWKQSTLHKWLSKDMYMMQERYKELQLKKIKLRKRKSYG